MVTCFDNFLNETRYFLENIDKKYYVFKIYKRGLYLIEILHKPVNDKKIDFKVLWDSGNFPYYSEKHYWPTYYTISLACWKRNLTSIVFSTNDIIEAENYINERRVHTPEDPYGEEDWNS